MDRAGCILKRLSDIFWHDGVVRAQANDLYMSFERSGEKGQYGLWERYELN